MTYLILVLVSLFFLLGFVALTRYEAVHSVRIFGLERAALDKRIDSARFILAHVDLPAFLNEEIVRFSRLVGHGIVHVSLQLVRAVERVLTRLVRHLRTRHTEPMAPRESARPFVRTLSEFKDTLKENTPNSEHLDI